MSLSTYPVLFSDYGYCFTESVFCLFLLFVFVCLESDGASFIAGETEQAVFGGVPSFPEQVSWSFDGTCEHTRGYTSSSLNAPDVVEGQSGIHAQWVWSKTPSSPIVTAIINIIVIIFIITVIIIIIIICLFIYLFLYLFFFFFKVIGGKLF